MRQFKQEMYYVFSENEICNLIQETFSKKEYNAAAEEEWTNDSHHAFYIDLSGYGDDERRDVQHFIEGTQPYKYWNCGLVWLLHELADRKEIPEGNYLIEVCW